LTAVTFWVPTASLTQIAVVLCQVRARVGAVGKVENVSRMIAAATKPAKTVGKLFVVVLAAWVVDGALWANCVLGWYSDTGAFTDVVCTGTEAERMTVFFVRVVAVLEAAVDGAYVVFAVVGDDRHMATDFGVARWVEALVDRIGGYVAALALVTDAGHRTETAQFAHLGMDCREGAGAQATHQ
jgi:hypothetical protein